MDFFFWGGVYKIILKIILSPLVWVMMVFHKIVFKCKYTGDIFRQMKFDNIFRWQKNTRILWGNLTKYIISFYFILKVIKYKATRNFKFVWMEPYILSNFRSSLLFWKPPRLFCLSQNKSDQLDYVSCLDDCLRSLSRTTIRTCCQFESSYNNTSDTIPCYTQDSV